jgi:GDP-L-fucose synthase
MPEDALLTGPLEPTNEWYAIAKIAGIKLVRGLPPPARLRLHLRHADQPLRPGRQLRPRVQHVVPALIRKFHEAKVPGAPRSRSGAPAGRGASSCTSTTSPTPACT